MLTALDVRIIGGQPEWLAVAALFVPGLVTGILGAAGVLAGQRLAAKGEERRWVSERDERRRQAREDLLEKFMAEVIQLREPYAWTETERDLKSATAAMLQVMPGLIATPELPTAEEENAVYFRARELLPRIRIYCGDSLVDYATYALARIRHGCEIYRSAHVEGLSEPYVAAINEAHTNFRCLSIDVREVLDFVDSASLPVSFGPWGRLRVHLANWRVIRRQADD